MDIRTHLWLGLCACIHPGFDLGTVGTTPWRSQPKKPRRPPAARGFCPPGHRDQGPLVASGVQQVVSRMGVSILEAYAPLKPPKRVPQSPGMIFWNNHPLQEWPRFSIWFPFQAATGGGVPPKKHRQTHMIPYARASLSFLRLVIFLVAPWKPQGSNRTAPPFERRHTHLGPNETFIRLATHDTLLGGARRPSGSRKAILYLFSWFGSFRI